MSRILIVDDEAYAREGIEAICMQAGLGDIALRTASSGREGLALAEMWQPDLVISDVRMPQLAGLDMAKMLLERFPRMKFIFISAYSEIDYYRTAMKLHAVSFVEKPIIPEELLGEVKRALSMVEYELRASQIKLTNEAQEELAMLSLLGRSSVPIIPEIAARIESCSMALFVVSRYDEEKVALLRENLSRSFYVLMVREDENLMLLLFPAPQDCAQIAQDMMDILGMNPFITYALPNQRKDIPHALNLAVARQQDSFFYAEAHALSVYEQKRIRSCPMPFSRSFYTSLTERVEKQDGPGVQTLLYEGLSQLNAPDACTPEQVRMSIQQLIGMFGEILTGLGIPSDFPSSAEIWTNLNAIKTFWEVQEYALKKGMQMLSQYAGLSEGGRIIYRIKREINLSFSDPAFSVSRLAERLQMSESYLGNLFKRKTGMTISVYINNVRMESAKRMLRDGTLRINEVAQMIGLENTDYFTKRFKQYTGQTPSEYRR